MKRSDDVLDLLAQSQFDNEEDRHDLDDFLDCDNNIDDEVSTPATYSKEYIKGSLPPPLRTNSYSLNTNKNMDYEEEKKVSS